MSTVSAYYNEIDPFKAEVLRQAIAAGAIAPGVVDERSIKDVKPEELMGYTQCHFFAGGGFWSVALRQAGWPDDRPCWTGSCPCQPFSNAGKRKRKSDERHLWPEWLRIIRGCRPPVIFGEQVAAAAGGKTCSEEEMQRLRDRETVRRVLYELERTAPRHMQILHAGCGETPEEGPGERSVAEASAMEGEETRIRPRECSPLPGEEEGTSLHDRSGEYSGEGGTWGLRSDGHTLRPQSESMERSLFGPDIDGGGLHSGEYESSDLRLECDGERLGYPESSGRGQRYSRAAYKAEFRTARVLKRCFEETPEWSWRDSVFADLERQGYACGSPVLGACSVGGSDIRQRLYFVAYAASERHDGRRTGEEGCRSEARQQLERLRDAGIVGDSFQSRLEGHRGNGDNGHEPGRLGEDTPRPVAEASAFSGMADDDIDGREQARFGESEAGDDGLVGDGAAGRVANAGYGNESNGRQLAGTPETAGSEVWQQRVRAEPSTGSIIGDRTSPLNGPWRDADWLLCRDGKWRPVAPRTFPLVNGYPGRVGALRLYGDAINCEVAKTFIECCKETIGELEKC